MFEFFRRKQTPPPRNERLVCLEAKIAELVARDTELKTFGARYGHQYRMNPVLPRSELAAFQREYHVQLPQDYADFLTQVGNGGIGPYYGLFSLDEAVRGHRYRAFLSTPFPLTECFNPYEIEFDAADEEFVEDWYLCGSIELAHQGCGYLNRLVITGPQAGQVWFDGEVSGQGLMPLGCDFYTWYDRWLTDALYEL